jgi:xanthine dehydrogenase YagR molybdenum-binding subunit
MLGLPIEQVRMELGDSDFPETAGSGGSWGAASAGSALYDACENLREKLAHSAGIDPARRSSPTAVCAAAARAPRW